MLDERIDVNDLMKLLLVEDDPGVATEVSKALRREGFVIAHADTGAQALALIEREAPEMIVLDLGLPDMEGAEVLKRIGKSKRAPVLVLTARDSIDSKVSLLDVGADDYLTKPFALPELLARLRALSRRRPQGGSSILSVGTVSLDLATHELTTATGTQGLNRREFSLLQALMEAPGRIQTRESLENRLYDWRDEIGSNAIEAHISNLRKKLPSGFVKTVRGVGYTIDTRPRE